MVSNVLVCSAEVAAALIAAELQQRGLVSALACTALSKLATCALVRFAVALRVLVLLLLLLLL